MATATGLARTLEHTRRKAKIAAETAERRMAISLSGAGLAFAEKRGVLPVAVAGIPSKLGLGIALTLLEANSSGATRRLAGAGADAVLAIYGYQAVKTQSFVAGDEGDEYVGEDVSGDEV